MPKKRYLDLLNHMTDPRFEDPSCRIHLPGLEDVLRFRGREIPGGWRELADLVQISVRDGAVWFPDSNIAIREEADPVWDALRLSALTSQSASTRISAPIWHELREWLESPKRHLARAAAIRDGLTAKTWVSEFGLRPDSTFLKAMCYYVHLLGFRRQMACPIADGTTIVGTDAADAMATMGAIRKHFGPRAIPLARGGREDHNARGEIVVNDEAHAILAVLHAIATGRETVIVTADLAFEEIFYKLQWFLDTHYRGFLAANLISDGKYGSYSGEVEIPEFFEGPVKLYRRPTLHLRDLLPTTPSTVLVSLILVMPEHLLRIVEVRFIREMAKMFEIRGQTGCCTDRFGSNNIHVDLTPAASRCGGLPCFGIGRDRRVEFKGTTSDKLGAEVSLLDLELSIRCEERHGQLRRV